MVLFALGLVLGAVVATALFYRTLWRHQRRGPKGVAMLSPDEGITMGLVQETNRMYLHGLGFALAANVVKDGVPRWRAWLERRFRLVEWQIWDDRDDPEGWAFGPGMIDPYKAENVAAIRALKVETRRQNFGWDIQPLPPNDGFKPVSDDPDAEVWRGPTE